MGFGSIFQQMIRGKTLYRGGPCLARRNRRILSGLSHQSTQVGAPPLPYPGGAVCLSARGKTRRRAGVYLALTNESA